MPKEQEEADPSKTPPRRKTRAKRKSPEKEHVPISRKELLEKALDIVAKDLEKKDRPTNAVASLVQLLKLERLFTEDEEQPHEIRVVWQETDDETDESAETSPEN
jgi:hypothetical protein